MYIKCPSIEKYYNDEKMIFEYEIYTNL